MSRQITYAHSGVDRKLRSESKKALEILRETYQFSRLGEVVNLPFGHVFPMDNNQFLDLVIEGVGTKVLIAQLAEKYDTIGIDGVAMAVNDVIRSGAKPLAIVDNIHAHVSNPALVREWLKGVTKGAIEAECVVPNGEIGDVPELIKGLTEGKGFDMVIAAMGIVHREKLITTRNLKAGDPIIGLRSSGLHSNGISLARKILFKKWGGKYEPHDTPTLLDRDVISETLEPTKIYVKPVLRAAEEARIKAAVHITGEAYAKFQRLRPEKSIGFEFDNFRPQPIFNLIQTTATQLGGMITDEEMFRTFNMGWGFAVIVDKTQKDTTIDALEETGTQAEQIGRVTNSSGIRVLYKGKRINLN